MSLAERIEQRTFKLERDLLPIANGIAPVPNPRNVDIHSACKSLAKNAPRIRMVPGRMNRRIDGTLFFFFVDNGRYDGTGYLINENAGAGTVCAMAFAICDHEWVGAPSRCKRCGFSKE